MEELASAASVSPWHLYRLFRQHYGCGPARALELARLSRAAVRAAGLLPLAAALVDG